MAHRPISQIWSQHFFRDPALAASVVAHLPLTRRDTVYEIGPGTGLLTAPLAERAGRVVAVEIDPALCAHLGACFAASPHVRIVHADFLTYPLPIHPYTVVSNVPFAITAAVVAKLLNAPHPPRAAYLIVQREATARFAGRPYETQYSVLAKPWFTLAATQTFSRTAFTPAPRVDAAMLEIHQRAGPLVAPEDADLYRAFVRYGFGWWRKSLKTSLRPVFSNLQFRRLAETLHFPLDATPTQLTFVQWLGLFRGFRMHVPPYKQQALVARVREGQMPVSRRQRGPIALPLPRPPPDMGVILREWLTSILRQKTGLRRVWQIQGKANRCVLQHLIDHPCAAQLFLALVSPLSPQASLSAHSRHDPLAGDVFRARRTIPACRDASNGDREILETIFNSEQRINDVIGHARKPLASKRPHDFSFDGL